jgi:flagellar biosynthesis protein FlhG
MSEERDTDPAGRFVLFREPGDEDDAPPLPPPRGSGPARIVSVSGAKGGVGKSILAANLAVYLSSIGRRVVLVDADADGANLHTLLGLRRTVRPRTVDADGEPSFEPPPLQPIDTSVQGLRLFHAGLDNAPAGAPRRARRRELESTLRALDADYVVVDLGSGTSHSLVDFHLAADLAVFVALPEPTSIENTFRFLRHAFARHLLRQVSRGPLRDSLASKLSELGGAPSPLDLWRRLEDDGDPLADPVRSWMDAFSPCLVINESRLRADLELGDAIRTTTRRRLGVTVDYLGHIDFDDTVWSSVRLRRLLLLETPGTKSAKSIEKIARRLLAIESGKARRRAARLVPPESHHDLLEVERGATDEDVRRAYKRAREMYSLDSLACYGLFDADEIEVVRRRLDEAYDVLLDPARRRPYELSVFPIEEDELDAKPSVERRRGDLPPAPEITPDTDITGALLRQVRESLGVELKDISQRTKVGLAYLKAIEDDDYTALPAPVYVRGFVSELAKSLRLDPGQASRTYLKRLRRFLDERGST